MLYPCGYYVSSAQNQNEGLKIATTQMPDLLILHLSLDITRKFLSDLHQKNLSIPAVLVVESQTTHIPIEFLRLGVKEFMVPPLLPINVQQTVEKILSSYHRQEAVTIADSLDRINRELEQRLKEYDRLFQINQSIYALLDTDSILCRAIEAAIFITDADEGYLLLLDEPSGEWFVRAQQLKDKKSVQCLKQPANGNLVKQVVYSGKPVLQNCTVKKRARTNISNPQLDIPIKVAETVIGVIAVKNVSVQKNFSPTHIYQLSIISKAVSTALKNANCYTSNHKNSTYTHK